MQFRTLLLSSSAAIALASNATAGPGDAYISIFGGLSDLTEVDVVHEESYSIKRLQNFSSSTEHHVGEPTFLLRDTLVNKNPHYYTATTYNSSQSTTAVKKLTLYQTRIVLGNYFRNLTFEYDRSFAGEIETDGWVIGAALGVELGGGFRAELEAAFRRFDLGEQGTILSATYNRVVERVDQVRAYYYSISRVVPGTGYLDYNVPFADQINFGKATTKTASGTIYKTAVYNSLDWYNRVEGFTATNLDATAEGELTAFSLMANIWYDFPLGDTGITPFIGGGIGVASVMLNHRFEATSPINIYRSIATETRWVYNGTNDTWTRVTYAPYTGKTVTTGGTSGNPLQRTLGTELKRDDAVFAYQFGAGLGYEFRNGLRFSAQYRYFGTADADFGPAGEARVETSDVLIGFSFPLAGQR